MPGFETLAVHAGQEADKATGAVVTPIHLATTYAQDAVGEHRGFEYSRTGNPTRAALETAVAALERARFAVAFSSGMAAADGVLRSLVPGDHVVMGNDAYGGTWRLIARVFGASGISHTSVNLADLGGLPRAMTDETKLVWLETPSNPLLGIVDVEAVSAIAHDAGALVVVDNTFATPYLQRPLSLGADIVVHSSTKYLGGHSDVVGGVAVTDDEEIASSLHFIQNAAGAVPSPFDCYLVLRGMKTLAVRMDRQCRNASVIAEFLAAHRSVSHVNYPGLVSHPGHELASRQMRDFGAMVSFTLRGGESQALAVAGKTELFTLAESLGAVESLVEQPARMTHLSAAGSPLEVDPALLRLSVGLENVDDLIDDLSRALA